MTTARQVVPATSARTTLSPAGRHDGYRTSSEGKPSTARSACRKTAVRKSGPDSAGGSSPRGAESVVREMEERLRPSRVSGTAVRQRCDELPLARRLGRLHQDLPANP